MLQKWMGVGPAQAQALMSELARLNIIHAPLGGIATAVEPIYRPNTVLGARPVGARIVDHAKDTARAWLEDESTEDVLNDTDEKADPDETS